MIIHFIAVTSSDPLNAADCLQYLLISTVALVSAVIILGPGAGRLLKEAGKSRDVEAVASTVPAADSGGYFATCKLGPIVWVSGVALLIGLPIPWSVTGLPFMLFGSLLLLFAAADRYGYLKVKRPIRGVKW